MPACALPYADWKIVSFIEDYNVIDKIIKLIKLMRLFGFCLLRLSYP